MQLELKLFRTFFFLHLQGQYLFPIIFDLCTSINCTAIGNFLSRATKYNQNNEKETTMAL